MDAHRNFAYSTVATAPSPATSGTSLVVASGDGAKFPAVPFNATVWATGANALTSNSEVVRVTAVSTDTLTITRAQEGTSARTVVVGDQIAATVTDKVLSDAEQGIEQAYRGTTGAIASTYDRALFTETTNIVPLSSGRLSVYRMFLPKWSPVSNISFVSGGTALSVGSNQWFVLFDINKNKVAITADDTSTAWPASTKKTLAVTGGPYLATYSGWYWVGILVVATTAPSMVGLTGLNGTVIHTANPVPRSTADSGLTNPASCPSPFGAMTAAANLLYAEIS